MAQDGNSIVLSSKPSDPDRHLCLWCWWTNMPKWNSYDQDSIQPFRIKTDENLKVVDLREEIKRSKGKKMLNIEDVEDILLWVVESPLSKQGYIDTGDAMRQTTGKSLAGSIPLTEMFDATTLNQNHLHIVITTGMCLTTVLYRS
jgi:hypothetical protein